MVHTRVLGRQLFLLGVFCENIGGAEAHFEEDIRKSLLTVHMSASGDSGPSIDPKGNNNAGGVTGASERVAALDERRRFGLLRGFI